MWNTQDEDSDDESVMRFRTGNYRRPSTAMSINTLASRDTAADISEYTRQRRTSEQSTAPARIGRSQEDHGWSSHPSGLQAQNERHHLRALKDANITLDTTNVPQALLRGLSIRKLKPNEDGTAYYCEPGGLMPTIIPEDQSPVTPTASVAGSLYRGSRGRANARPYRPPFAPAEDLLTTEPVSEAPRRGFSLVDPGVVPRPHADGPTAAETTEVSGDGITRKKSLKDRLARGVSLHRRKRSSSAPPMPTVPLASPSSLIDSPPPGRDNRLSRSSSVNQSSPRDEGATGEFKGFVRKLSRKRPSARRAQTLPTVPEFKPAPILTPIKLHPPPAVLGLQAIPLSSFAPLPAVQPKAASTPSDCRQTASPASDRRVARPRSRNPYTDSWASDSYASEELKLWPTRDEEQTPYILTRTRA